MTGYFKIGFTGTRTGMTTDQSATLRERLSKKHTTWTMFSEFHHGDCTGADEEAHEMMRVLVTRNWPLRVDIIIHPPVDFRWRAGCGTSDEEAEGLMQGMIKILPEKPYLERDRDIVDATDMLIACPAGFDDRGNGGTWYTVRYAMKQVKPILLIWPDGSIGQDNWDLTPEEREKLRQERKANASG